MPHISEAPVLQINRFYTGLYTFRNPLVIPVRQMGRRLIELYDALSGGQNMEITNLLTLKRRPGYTSYNTNNVTGIPQAFYSFKPSSFPGNVFPVVDTTTNVQYVPPGSTAPTSLITKSTNAQTNFAGIGPYLYMGNPNFSKKWDSPLGSQGVTNWGISISSVNNATGPLTANTGTSPGGGFQVWTNPGNITGNVSFATNILTIGQGFANTTGNLQGTNFGFGVAGASTITGIQVTFNLSASFTGGGVGQTIYTTTVTMLKNGTAVGTAKQTNSFGTPLTFGGSSDLWGTTWTPNDINNTNFGFEISVNIFNVGSATRTYTISANFFQISVFGQGGPSVGLVAGGLSAQTGYQYVVAYGNSVSGHVSSPSPVSSNTGPFAGPNGVQITLTASTDPQVNQIRVFRTTDGGGQPFFELPNSPFPNSSGGVTDNATDSTLQIGNICPVPHFNDPPPPGLVDPVWFSGRLWGHVGNLLYFASGPDVTMGNGQEAWYPVYVFSLPATIIRKFPLPNGMIVATVDDLYIVRGIDSSSFTVNEFMRDIGMRVWNAADTDGSNLYIYTTDRQMIVLNANGVQSISSQISDVIANVDPSVAYVSIFRYTARNTLLFLGDGTTNIYPFNLQQQAWCPVQVPSNGVTAIASIETQPGVYNFLLGKNTANQTVAQRALTTFTDEATPYSCFATFGPIPFADALTLAQVRDIVVSTAANGSTPTISVLANEISGTFQGLGTPVSSEPPELSATPSQSFTSNRYTWQNTQLSELLNFMSLQISWPTASTADELYLWAIGGTQTTGGSALGPPGKLPELQGR